MQKLVVVVLISFVSVLGFAQETAANSLVKVETVKENLTAKKITTSNESKLITQLKSPWIELNQKKSNDLISIKAYRKSLQIKIKEIKLC